MLRLALCALGISGATLACGGDAGPMEEVEGSGGSGGSTTASGGGSQASGGGTSDTGGSTNGTGGSASGSRGSTAGTGGTMTGTGGNPNPGSGGASAGSGGSGATMAPCGPAASENDQGILTSHPGITFSVGDPGFSLDTVNIVPSTAPSGIDTLDLYAELTNVSGETQCYLFFDALLDGIWEILVQAKTQPLKQEVVSTTGDCVLAGETAILVGIQNDIPIAEVDAATTLEFNLTFSQSFSALAPATDGPTVEAEISAGMSGGDLVSGTITPLVDIRNYGMRFYPRDTRGLLVDELLAFPGELESLPAGVSMEFSTLESECQFTEYEFTHSWIYED